MVRITFEGVDLKFGGKEVFRSLEADMKSGSVTVVTGRNGSGKSTFLRLAARLLPPDRGRVTAEEAGKPLEREEYRSRIAMLSPEMKLYPRLTAEENLRFLAGLRGRTLHGDAVTDLWERVGLASSEVGEVFAGQLSTGMRQRVKFALLLASEAEVWMLDEPCANLDAGGTQMLMEEARRAASGGKLVLWATNALEEEEIGDEVIRLSGD